LIQNKNKDINHKIEIKTKTSSRDQDQDTTNYLKTVLRQDTVSKLKLHCPKASEEKKPDDCRSTILLHAYKLIYIFIYKMSKINIIISFTAVGVKALKANSQVSVYSVPVNAIIICIILIK